MIIWLASYPKSGNTWIRLFLNTLLYSKETSVDINNIYIQQFPNKKHFGDLTNDIGNVSEFVKNCNLAQTKLNLDNKIKFFKTHNALWKSGSYSFTEHENTLGVIYIVRDPRNVITSIKNHYAKKNYDDALEFMRHQKKFIGSQEIINEYEIPTLISSWSTHYNSWKKLKKNYLLIKYENLLKNPFDEFSKITDYLKKNTNLRFSKDLILKAIDECNFQKLRKQENQNGFKEAPTRDTKFFFLGPENNWRKMLDKKTVEEIENNFRDEMTELNYL